MQRIGHITIFVKDLDEALNFYTQTLDFKVSSDITMPNGFRWLTVTAADQADHMGIAFIKAETEEQLKLVGSQVATHILFTLVTDDCMRDYEKYLSRGVKFYGEPKSQPWGTEVVFEDLYGNRMDLIERSEMG